MSHTHTLEIWHNCRGMWNNFDPKSVFVIFIFIMKTKAVFIIHNSDSSCINNPKIGRRKLVPLNRVFTKKNWINKVNWQLFEVLSASNILLMLMKRKIMKNVVWIVRLINQEFIWFIVYVVVFIDTGRSQYTFASFCCAVAVVIIIIIIIDQYFVKCFNFAKHKSSSSAHFMVEFLFLLQCDSHLRYVRAIIFNDKHNRRLNSRRIQEPIHSHLSLAHDIDAINS